MISILGDLPLKRGRLTWSDGLKNQSMAILDQFLVSKDQECHFIGMV